MFARINGEEISIENGISIEQFLREGKINLKAVVVEYNCKILTSSDWPKVVLKDGDNLEIVSFVGGG